VIDFSTGRMTVRQSTTQNILRKYAIVRVMLYHCNFHRASLILNFLITMAQSLKQTKIRGKANFRRPLS